MKTSELLARQHSSKKRTSEISYDAIERVSHRFAPRLRCRRQRRSEGRHVRERRRQAGGDQEAGPAGQSHGWKVLTVLRNIVSYRRSPPLSPRARCSRADAAAKPSKDEAIIQLCIKDEVMFPPFSTDESGGKSILIIRTAIGHHDNATLRSRRIFPMQIRHEDRKLAWEAGYR